jgi:beta-glucosidase
MVSVMVIMLAALGWWSSLLAEFGASDAAILDVIFRRAWPEGKLPFELPSSLEAVCDQKGDAPYDSQDPLYALGYGLAYSSS